MKLTEEEISSALPRIPQWKREEDKWIVRKYKFSDFLAAVEFVNQVAQLSEAAHHHPFIAIDYKLVTLKMSSWSAGGLTKLDIDLAEKFDKLFQK